MEIYRHAHRNKKCNYRHRASTSMYSLPFRVRVATPAQYGRNGTASLQITSHTQQAHRFYRWCVRAQCVRRALGLAVDRWALPHISIMLPQQRNPCTDCKSAQQCTTINNSARIHMYSNNITVDLYSEFLFLPLTAPSYIRVRAILQAILQACGRRQTDTQTRVTTIHFSSSSTHAKCNYTTVFQQAGDECGLRTVRYREIDNIMVQSKL